MKKGIIAAAGLLLCAGISTGSFIYVKNKSEQQVQNEAKKTADNVLFDFDSDSISKVTLSSPEGDFSFVYENKKWICDPSSDSSFDVNQSTVQGICTVFSKLKATKNYGSADEESRKKYGLSDPYVITVTADGTEYVLDIGDASPTGDYCYAAANGKDNIYALLASDADSLISDRFGLIDNDFLPYSDSDITQMTIVRDGKTTVDLTLDPDAGIWVLPDEYKMLTVNQTRPSTLLTTITRLTAVQIIEEDLSDLSKYGFDKPFAEFIVKTKDGSQRTILMSKYGNDAAAYTYVYIKESGLVETYYASDMSFVDYSIYDLITQTVESANLYNISAFEFSCAEASDSFTVDMSAPTATIRGADLDLTKAEVKNMFENFYNFFSYINITSIDLESKPELKDPSFSAKYTVSNGSETTIDLVSDGSGSEYYVFANGKYTGTKTVIDFLSGPNSMMSAYQLVCGYAGLEPNTAE